MCTSVVIRLSNEAAIYSRISLHQVRIRHSGIYLNPWYSTTQISEMEQQNWIYSMYMTHAMHALTQVWIMTINCIQFVSVHVCVYVCV